MNTKFRMPGKSIRKHKKIPAKTFPLYEIQLDPMDAASFGDRGSGWHHKAECDKAIADYDVLIRLNPKDSHMKQLLDLAKNKKPPEKKK